MKESILVLAKRYAKAALELAREADAIEQVGRELDVLAQVCLADTKARAFWRSLKVPDDEKRHTLQDILEQMDALGTARNTANLLLDRGRFSLLPEIVAAYRAEARRISRVVHATVTAAFELSEELQERLRRGLAQMTGEDVAMTTEVDPELIGGITVRVDNRIIDGSARGRLQALSRSFA